MYWIFNTSVRRFYAQANPGNISGIPPSGLVETRTVIVRTNLARVLIRRRPAQTTTRFVPPGWAEGRRRRAARTTWTPAAAVTLDSPSLRNATSQSPPTTSTKHSVVAAAAAADATQQHAAADTTSPPQTPRCRRSSGAIRLRFGRHGSATGGRRTLAGPVLAALFVRCRARR